MKQKIHDAQAKSLAERYVEKNIPPPKGDSLMVSDEFTETVEDGWFFYYQSRQYLVTKDYKFFLVGTCPIFVSVDGSIVEPRDPSRSARKN